MSSKLSKAIKFVGLGKLANAKKILRKLVKEKPVNAEAHFYYGSIMAMQGDTEEALKYLALATRGSQAKACWYDNYAVTLEVKGLNQEAAKAYRLAEIKGCKDEGFYTNYGIFLCKAKQYEKAETFFASAINIDNQNLRAFIGLSQVYIEQDRLDEAVQVLEHCLNIGIQHADVFTNLGLALSLQGRGEESISCYQSALELEPENKVVLNSRVLQLLYLYDDPELIFKEVKTSAKELNKDACITFDGKGDCTPGRKIRLGFVSADFYNHAIANLILSVFENINHDKFTIISYYNNNIYDSITETAQHYSDAFRTCQHLSDDELESLIRLDSVDILIDLSNHTKGNRLAVFSRKPAPVQINFMGAPVSTGLNSIDYMITDSLRDPIGDSDKFYSEKLLRLPWASQFKQLSDMPEIVPPPSTTTGYITFGATNSLRKINNETIEAWANILKRVPHSKLNIFINDYSNLDMHEHVYSMFESHGIDKSRLRLQGKMVMKEYLASYNEIDIALDTYPYNGFTTTFHALLMGVPVISYAGKTRVSRNGFAILSLIDKADWATDNWEDYANKAIEIASNVDALISIRTELRRKIQSSKIMDYAGYTDNFQKALVSIWDDYCLTIN